MSNLHPVMQQALVPFMPSANAWTLDVCEDGSRGIQNEQLNVYIPLSEGFAPVP